jgi:integrase
VKATIREVKRTENAIQFYIRIQGVLTNGVRIKERYWREYESKQLANVFARARIEALIKGEAEPNEHGNSIPTLERFYEDDFKPLHFKRGRRGEPLKPSRISDYESIWRVHLLPRFGKTPIDAFDSHEIEKFAAELAVGRKQKTINEILTILGTILRKAKEWREVVVPAIEIGQVEQEEIEFWTFDDFDRLAAEAKRRGKYHHAVVLLGARAGLRAGEILSLRWSDIDIDRRVIRVGKATWREHENKPKSNKRRYVPLTADLAEALSALPDSGARVIRAPRVKQATIETLRSYINACEIGAELKSREDSEKGQIHKLRHTFGAHLAMRGVSLLVIQQLMGHASYKTTLRYAHLAPNTLHEAVEGALLSQVQRLASASEASAKLLELQGKIMTPTGFEPVEKRRG